MTEAEQERARVGQARQHPSDGGKVRLMAERDGWVMARRPGRIPFAVDLKEWLGWPEYSDVSRDHLKGVE